MSIYAERARYIPVEQGFNIERPALEPQAFVAEMARAFADDAPTGFVPLDLSRVLGTAYAATTPFMLARYARVRRGERLDCTLCRERRDLGGPARRAGRWRAAPRRSMAREDMFALPGGSLHMAGRRGLVLWS